MKKLFTIVLFSLLSFNIFSYSGVFTGNKELKYVETKWFQIIYPPESEATAKIIYENADRIYQEVTAQYGLIPGFKMPVIITPNIDIPNAFFSPAPYNRIVLFDTSSQTMDQLSSSFSEPILSVFTHELTHAVTLNMKNGFWQGFTNVLGDCMLPGAFFVTSGMAEGAAVASESSKGEGRLNDEYAKHYVKQAKIENKFPSFYDVQGAADNLVSGIQYYFNGAFHQWLQKKYGLEKYGEFWHRVLNLNRLGMTWSFKKTYGISVRNAWKEFKNSYEVPDIPGNPVEAGVVQDFFEEGKSKYSTLNSSGARYHSLKVSDRGLIFCQQNGQKVYFVSNDQLGNEKIKPKLLFTQVGVESVSTSKDGKYIAVSYITNSYGAIASKIKIFDVDKNKFYDIEKTGIKNGTVVKNGADYFLVCHKYENACNHLVIYKLDFNSKEIIEENPVVVKQPLNTFITSFIDLGTGDFAFIKKDGSQFGVAVGDCNGNIKSEYKMPENIAIRDISEKDGQLYFSWARNGTLPRLGHLSKNGQLYLSNFDISGGVFSPVVFEENDSQRVAFIGEFYNESRILSYQLNAGQWESNKIAINNKPVKIGDIESQLPAGIPEAKTYKSFQHPHKGLIIPLSVYTTEFFGINYGANSYSQYFPIGITYATSNPWNNGFDDLLIFTAGWNYLSNSFGFETIANVGTSTDLLQSIFDFKTEFDGDGWKMSSGEITVSSMFNMGRMSHIFIQNNLKLTGGRQSDLSRKLKFSDIFTFWDKELFGTCKPKIFDPAYIISDFLYLSYSNIHRTGPGRFETGGFSVGVNVGGIYDTVIGNVFTLVPDFKLAIPKLVPFDCRRGFVYNLPVNLSVEVMPLFSDYGLTGATLKEAGYGVLDANIETVLFGIDIQNSIPFLDSWLFQDFYIKAGYNSSVTSYIGTRSGFQFPYFIEYMENLGTGKSLYLDSVYCKAVIEVNSNIGVLANPGFKLQLYGMVSYPIHVMPKDKQSVQLKFGIEGIF